MLFYPADSGVLASANAVAIAAESPALSTSMSGEVVVGPRRTAGATRYPDYGKMIVGYVKTPTMGMGRALVIAISLAAVGPPAEALAQDRWGELRAQVFERNRRDDVAGAVRAAEHLLNLADSDFANDRERGLEALTLLSAQYRMQQAYGQEELTRYRELELWFALKAPSPTADRSIPAEADQDLEEVRAHYAPTPLISPTPLALLSNRVDQYSVTGHTRGRNR